MDQTEPIRRQMVQEINSQVQSNSEDIERERLTKIYNEVWNTKEVQEDFEIISFMAPFVVATRKADNKKGALQFQDRPRFYFNFKAL